MREYRRDRSKFWLKIYDDNDITVSTSGMVKELLEKVSPKLSNYSPTGWRKSKNHNDVFNLWIPPDWMNKDCLSILEEMELWIKRANQYIWLGKNRYTRNKFSGDEVDYCLAADWNFAFDEPKRTAIGEAEYQLKYAKCIDQKKAIEYIKTLILAIFDCMSCLPFDMSDFLVATIPAVRKDQNKLAWCLAKYIAKELKVPFVAFTLTKEKPQIKELCVDDKIDLWRKIFEKQDMIEFTHEIKEKKILIIDDLYQSGASIWCFAEYLKKKYNVKKVIAICLVKALKDGDNL